MIFAAIVLENIGTFSGRHEINLAPESTSRPIVLIGALNGSGKTTLLEAFQLALYGRRAKSLLRIKKSFDDYIRELRHRNSPRNAVARVELTLCNNESGKRTEYRIVRSWAFVRATPTESLEVYVDGQFDLTLTEIWEEEVERLIPLNLSHLFFFDGERIETLADPDQSADILRVGIRSLLGLELVDQLHSDLSVFRRRMGKRSIQEDSSRLNILEAENEQLQGERKVLLEQLADLNTQIDSARHVYKKARSRFASHGGDAYETSSKKQGERAELIARLREVDHELRELAAGPLPLLLVESLLHELAKGAERQAAIRESALIAEQLIKRDAAFLAWLRSINSVSPEVLSQIDSYLAKFRNKFENGPETDVSICMADVTIHKLHALLDTQLADCKSRASKVLKRRTTICERLDSVERALEHVPDESLISSYIEAQAVAKNNLDSLCDQKERVEEQLRQNGGRVERNANALEREISQLAAAEKEQRINERMRSYSLVLQETLDSLRKRTLLRHIVALEKHISSAFSRLARKESLVHSMRINPDDFSITLLGYGDSPLSPHLLSAGERQILAVAILWGLGKAASRSMPIVIDTPLGRLDSLHRKRLVEQYFPEASHQVILLSTDEEIDPPLLKDLNESVTHKYTLEFADSQGATTVKQGYFQDAQ